MQLSKIIKYTYYAHKSKEALIRGYSQYKFDKNTLINNIFLSYTQFKNPNCLHTFLPCS